MPVEFSFEMLAPPPPTSPESELATSSEGTRPYAQGSARPYLGFGLLVPFRRDQKGDFAAGAEVAVVKASISQVLGVRCSGQGRQGELPWRPEFGSLLYLLKHKNLDDEVTKALARTYVADALARWEPRCRLRAVSVTSEKSKPTQDIDTLRVRVRFDVITSNVVGNQVVIRDQTHEVEVG